MPQSLTVQSSDKPSRKRTFTISKLSRFFNSTNSGSANCNDNLVNTNTDKEYRSLSSNSIGNSSFQNNDSASNGSSIEHNSRKNAGRSSSNPNSNFSSNPTNNNLKEKENNNNYNNNIPVHVTSPPSNAISRSSSIRTATTKQLSVNLSSNSNSSSNLNARFIILPDGTHEHQLRRMKRQEKLGQMVKDWLGGNSGNKRSDAVSAVPNIFSSNNLNEMDSQIKAVLKLDDSFVNNNGTESQKKLPPSLFSTYVNEQQQNNNNSSNITQPNFHSTDKEHHESFFEKYGSCQEIIGRGAFGIVRVSHKKINNKEEILYAVKEFTKRTNEPDSKYSKRLTYEFCISSSLKHDNIINAYDLFKDSKGEYCEVMEYCSGGDLYSLIASAGKLEYIEADCFFKQIMRAVHYMHNMGVSHRDIKPENILLTMSGRVKITDFGSAECFKTAWEDEVQLSSDVKGSSSYIAPEQFTNREFDPRCVDVWSCGVVYMAMRTGRQLWKEAKIDDEFFHEYIRKRKCEKGYEPIEMLKRARCRNVIYSILDPNPERRITTLQILNSEWVREIFCCKN
jgi:protein-serine/threonine kinase